MTQIQNAYCSTILTLDDNDKRVDIPRRIIENLLTVHIGATKPATLGRHIRIMTDLGYLKLTAHGFGPDSMRYDLVASKVKEARANLEK